MSDTADEATEILHYFTASDEHEGGKRTVRVDTDGILTVIIERDADWSRDQDSRYETKTFRLVEVEPAWVEVQR